MAPVGGGYSQTLVRVRRKGKDFLRDLLLPVMFVPMTGEAEKKRGL